MTPKRKLLSGRTVEEEAKEFEMKDAMGDPTSPCQECKKLRAEKASLEGVIDRAFENARFYPSTCHNILKKAIEKRATADQRAKAFAMTKTMESK